MILWLLAGTDVIEELILCWIMCEKLMPLGFFVPFYPYNRRVMNWPKPFISSHRLQSLEEQLRSALDRRTSTDERRHPADLEEVLSRDLERMHSQMVYKVLLYSSFDKAVIRICSQLRSQTIVVIALCRIIKVYTISNLNLFETAEHKLPLTHIVV